MSGARGRFITFEGGEGSGKSTQIRRLLKALLAEGVEAVVTREPGGSPAGERIRALLLDPASHLDALTQLLLFCAARRDHVVALIEPALERGAWVLCDRFTDSTRAYQGAAGDLDDRLVASLEQAVVGAARPDLTLILDIAPHEGLARARRRLAGTEAPDAFEAADVAYHERVRQAFLAIAAAEPERCAVVAADGSEDDVADEIDRIWRERLRPGPRERGEGRDGA